MAPYEEAEQRITVQANNRSMRIDILLPWQCF